MPGYPLLTPPSLSSPSPPKTFCLYEFSPRTRKLGLFRSVFKPRSCPDEVLGKINGGDVSMSFNSSISGRIPIVTGMFEKNKEVNYKCCLNSTIFGYEMSGKIGRRGFAKLPNFSNWDRFNGNFEKNRDERHQLKLRFMKVDMNSGVFGMENYNDRCNWKLGSIGNELQGKINDHYLSRSLNFSNSVSVGGKNGRIRFVRGGFEKTRGERDGLKLNCIKKNWNSENQEILDELVPEKEGNGFEFGTHRKVGGIDDSFLHPALSMETEEKILGRKFAVNGAGFGNGKKQKNPDRDPSLSSSFDLLKLERDLENEEDSGTLEDSVLVPAEGSHRSDTESEGGEFVGGSGLRTKKQVLRRSAMLAKQVISMQSALSLGFISQLWVDTRSWVVLLVEVRPSMLSGEMERFLLEDVCQVGDFVLVQDESVLENEFKMIGLDTLVGYNVVTPAQRNVGKVRGYTFNMNSGAVELLELDSFGISIIPASLVSTYGLPVDDVLEVTSDTVVVHEDAASRVQRLSKGFWDTRNMEFCGDELRGYSDLGRQPIRSVRRRRSQNIVDGQKFPRKMKDTEGDWDLPMDY